MMKKTRLRILATTGAAAFFGLLIWQCGLRLFTVAGASNYPNMGPGDMVAVNLAHYGLAPPFFDRPVVRWAEPERGEIVLFEPPESDHLRNTNVPRVGRPIPMIKRVVAIPGDTVEMQENRLFINDSPMLYTLHRKIPMTSDPFDDDTLFVATEACDEAARKIAIRTDCDPGLCTFGPIVVPGDCYFLLGDNRDFSIDSRQFGPIHRDQILGRFAGHISRSRN